MVIENQLSNFHIIYKTQHLKDGIGAKTSTQTQRIALKLRHFHFSLKCSEVRERHGNICQWPVLALSCLTLLCYSMGEMPDWPGNARWRLILWPDKSKLIHFVIHCRDVVNAKRQPTIEYLFRLNLMKLTLSCGHHTRTASVSQTLTQLYFINIHLISRTHKDTFARNQRNSEWMLRHSRGWPKTRVVSHTNPY